jgi:hypothetical protein
VAKRRDFRVRPEQWRTEDQFSVCFWIFGEKSSNDIANWIIRGSHSKEELIFASVVLLKPALQASFCFAVAAFERLQESD